MFHYKQCEVTRSETTVFAVRVAPWEVALLAAVNGPDVVKVVGDVLVEKPLPDPGVEYDRLATKYGSDKEGGGQEFVALVYGMGARGVEAIAKEIEKAAQKAAVVAAAAAPAGDLGDLVDDPTAELFADLPKMAEGASAISE